MFHYFVLKTDNYNVVYKFTKAGYTALYWHEHHYTVRYDGILVVLIDTAKLLGVVFAGFVCVCVGGCCFFGFFFVFVS